MIYLTKGDEEMNKKLITPDEIAEYFRTSRQNIHNKIQSGEIKAIRFGKFWRIEQEEFDRLKVCGVNAEQPICE